MKCTTCGKRITIGDSYKIDCKHEDRICRQCVKDGRINAAIEMLIHNDAADEINRKLGKNN